jgi:hypothetical protein
VFHIRCPLGHALEITPEHFGQRLMCPICQAVVYSSPPRPGERPGAKFEVQCSHGHILRVKSKYLGKEVNCPSCQEKVSMKVSNLLAFSGVTLGVAVPDQVAEYKRELKAKQAKKQADHQKAELQKKSPGPMPAPPGRIPAPPSPPVSTTELASYEHVQPLPPHLASEAFEINRAAVPPAPPPPADFELDIIDTQFRIDMEKPVTPTVGARQRPEALFPGRIPPPPHRESDGTIELEAAPSEPKQPPPPQFKSPPEAEQVHIPCPNGHVLAIEKQYLGQKIQCPLCQTVIETAPVASDEPPPTESLETFQIPCPNGHLLEIEHEYRGLQVQCPLCQAIINVPK